MHSALRHLPILLGAALLAACASSRTTAEKSPVTENLIGEIRVTEHRVGDDLLSAGLGLAGLRGSVPAFSRSEQPDVAELRRRAIYSSWRGIADLGPLGGYGEIYGAVPVVTGREYSAFARVPGASQPHRVLVQVPDLFNRQARCVVVTASSGSRGVYGSIALAGAWGLPRGCAVAYTDKGAGSGYFDVASSTGVQLDGSRAASGHAALEFAPLLEGANVAADAVLVKHAHSADNPEADWGRHVLQAAQFALRALDAAFPDDAPFTAANTRIIAAGLSNGGGAVLRAAEIDDGMLAGVVAIEPNIFAGDGGRSLFDYVTEAALLAPCALLDARFAGAPFARVNGVEPPAWRARCAALRARGELNGDDQKAQSADAYARLRASGWSDGALASAASTTALDLWRAVAVTYAAAYARSGPGDMPCGYRFATLDAAGATHAPTATERTAWWADASGIPPGAAIGIVDSLATGDDPVLPGLLCLRALAAGSDRLGRRVLDGVAQTRAALPRKGLPITIVHGRDDGLVPMAFSSDPYVRWLGANGRQPVYWRIANAQHFDAFLAFPGFGDRYVPMLPYAYAALDHLWAHLSSGVALPPSRDIVTTPRGNGVLGAAQLGEIPGD